MPQLCQTVYDFVFRVSFQFGNKVLQKIRAQQIVVRQPGKAIGRDPREVLVHQNVGTEPFRESVCLWKRLTERGNASVIPLQIEGCRGRLLVGVIQDDPPAPIGQCLREDALPCFATISTSNPSVTRSTVVTHPDD